MRKKVLYWTMGVLLGSGLLLALCALCVFVVDPFEHYRESAILPRYANESYSNPGIAKNYDYDAVILGTSMVEMTKTSLVDKTFGVHSVKLPMRGSYTAQMGYELKQVLSRRLLRLAILGVDVYSLEGFPQDHDELFDYLWNDDVFDDVQYLLNRDVLLVEVPGILRNLGKSLENKRDEMYTWTDVTFGKDAVLAATPVTAQQEMLPVSAREERIEENIRLHLEPYIAAHPETVFKLYLPPYSAAYWYHATRIGLADCHYYARRRLAETLLAYQNVELYDFSSRLDWIEDLDEYCDYSHHSAKISDALIESLMPGEALVTSPEEMDEGSERIRQAAERFAEMVEH